MLVQGRIAVQEPAGQNALACAAGTAFALAVNEAVAQGEQNRMAVVTAQGEQNGMAVVTALGEQNGTAGVTALDEQNGMPGVLALGEQKGIACVTALGEQKGIACVTALGGQKGMSGTLAEGMPDEKDKGKLDLSLCLSGIPVLYTQGAYQMLKAADAVTAGDQTLSLTGHQAAKDEVQGQSVGGSAAVKAGPIAPEELLNKPDAPAELAGFRTSKGPAPKDSAVREPVKADTANAASEPIPNAAKEKGELDQADFRNIQNPQTQSTAKAAQFVGNDSAREAVKPSSIDLGESVPVIRGMATLAKQDKDKEKPVHIPAAGLVMAHKAEQAIHAEGAQSTKGPAPENTVPEENAAMQVARASVHALRRGMAEYRIRLSPEGLGNVEVTVVTKGKAVTLSMRTDNEMARGLILDHSDELRAELNQQNYQVSGLSVEVGTDGGNTAGFFAQREHAGPVYDTGRQITDQAAPDAKDRGNNADPRVILPRSSTISYRI